MVADAGTAAIVQAVVTLGHSLAMRVTAEGVETKQQLSLLREMGYDEVQGYLLGNPSPALAFEHLVANHRSAGGSEADLGLITHSEAAIRESVS